MNTEIKGYGARPVICGSLKDYCPVEGKIKNSFFSRMEIKGHVKKYGVDLSCCRGKKPGDYSNFSDYLSRSYDENARPVDNHWGGLISPCDGWLMAHFINSFSMIACDGYMYSVNRLIGDPAVAKEFAEGIALFIRLDQADPHRFVYIDNGVVCCSLNISDDPNPEKMGLYAPRHYSLLKTESFYKIAQVEICGNPKAIEQVDMGENAAFVRGQDKGRFLCDNAAVLLLFKKGVIHPDDEFMVNTGLGKETRVRMGERIGHAISY